MSFTPLAELFASNVISNNRQQGREYNSDAFALFADVSGLVSRRAAEHIFPTLTLLTMSDMEWVRPQTVVGTWACPGILVFSQYKLQR